MAGILAAALAPRNAAANPAVYEIGADPDVGFNLVSWFNFGGTGASTWQNSVQAVYDAGFREISLSPVRYFNLSTGAIAATSTKGPELNHIAAGIVRAKSLGMRVTVNPFIEPIDFTTWRGTYNPTPNTAAWTTFWNDYQQYLVDVAQVAEANGADAMTVGTELKALNGNAGNIPKWHSAINAADAQFSGELGYAANWDDYKNANLTTAIWEHPAIDFLGVDSYFRNLVTNSQADASGAFPNPTFIAQMEAGWNNLLDNQILSFAAQRQGGAGLPVVLTEVGYLPRNRTSVTPQNESGAVDAAEQTMAFNGLINAIDGRKEQLRAVHVWQWGMPGSDGSLWNMDPALPANQPNNVPATQWLSSYVNTATPAFAADMNADGTVDGADLAIWTAAYAATAAGDVDGDGATGGADFLLWQRQVGFGVAQSSTAAAVPEPAAWILLAAGLLACRRRRRDRP